MVKWNKILLIEGAIFLSLFLYFLLVAFGLHKTHIVGDILGNFLLVGVPFLSSLVLHILSRSDLIIRNIFLFPFVATFFYSLAYFWGSYNLDVTFGATFFIMSVFGLVSMACGMCIGYILKKVLSAS